MVKRTETEKSTLAIVKDEPADIRGALALRDLVAKFAEGAADRATLSDDDRALLNSIRAAIGGDGAALRFAVVRGLTKLRLDVIETKVAELFELNTESTSITVGTQRIDVPAIELVNVRQVVGIVAGDLVRAIDTYVAGRRAEIDLEDRTIRGADANLEAARAIPVLAISIDAYTQAERMLIRHPDFGVAHGALDGAERLLGCMLAALEATGEVPKDAFRAYDLAMTIRRQERSKFEAERKAAAA
jgi:hypothetical protein